MSRLVLPSTAEDPTKECSTLHYDAAADKLVLREVDCWDDEFNTICEVYPDETVNCSSSKPEGYGHVNI